MHDDALGIMPDRDSYIKIQKYKQLKSEFNQMKSKLENELQHIENKLKLSDIKANRL